MQLDKRANQLQVLQLRLQGRNDEEIIEITGFSPAFVSKAAQEVLRRQEAEDANYYRMIQNERLNTLMRSWWDQAHGGDIEAANFVLKLYQEQNKLNGLYKQQAQQMGVSQVEYQKQLKAYIEFEAERIIRERERSKVLEADVVLEAETEDDSA